MQRSQHWTKTERAEIEAVLSSELERIERALQPVAFAGGASEPSAWGESDVSENPDAFSPAALLQTDGRYHALTEALRRLKEGTYGLCVDCSKPIPTGRLLVIPETDHCIGCRSVS